MTTVEHLIALAGVYADAAVRADRDRRTAREADGPPAQAEALTAVRHADDAVERARTALRLTLRQALEGPVHAVPDERLPVCTWRQGQIEVRGVSATGDRAVRVRYTAVQALSAGAGLIACAAITDQRRGGTLSSILGAFASAADTGEHNAPWFGGRA